MAQAVALTHADPEHGIEPRLVRGELAWRHNETLDYTVYTVNGEVVDPLTIRTVREFATNAGVRLEGKEYADQYR